MQWLCLSLVVVRCQPLRRALCVFLASVMINQNFFLAMRHG
ncbi:hypothetical protein VCHE09_3303 [Vibrio paracholerae HE-09]|nr:hypothetical protein VCHE09_3303 [Vibrio paracholerae HE-09]